MTRTSSRVVAALVVALMAAWSTVARAQNPAQPPAQPTVQPPVRQPPADTTRPPVPLGAEPRDSVGLGQQKELVKWAPDDSLIAALRERGGYRPVRYQGDTVRFQAQKRVLELTGKPAAVQRDETLLVGHSVVYNDSTQKILATADSTKRDSVVLRDKQQADVIVRTSIEYDLAAQAGVIRNFSTAATQGETWYVSGQRGAVVTDTTVSGGRIFFAHKGAITTCADSIPHYHFQARDIKYIQKSLLVVRPAVLYIADVPVLWLPFVFQDTRSGRRSGMLPPRFGVAELVRNSPSYHRSIENLGYYFNMGNYADAQAWFDWRSGARGDVFDPGYVQFTGETRYRVLDRFLQGRLSTSYMARRDGSKNTAITLQHEQAFNQNRRISANVNWVQSTTIQRQTSYDPNRVLGTIASQINYQDKFGPLTFSAGGSRKQYPGRSQVDQDFPNLNISSHTINVTPWLDWTPTASLSNSQSFDIDQGTQFDSVFAPNANGVLRAHHIKASRRNTQASFETPLKIFDWQWQNSFRFTDEVQDYPQTRVVYRDIRDTSTKETRTFVQTYTSNLFYTTGFSLPRFFQGTWNVSPTVSIANVDPSFGLFVRSERTGGQWVTQGFRTSFGLSAAPTFYAFPPGFGRIERFRHSINPVLSYSYSPAKSVSDRFLAAVGATRQGYLGSLNQSRMSLQLSTNLEAKLRPRAIKETKDSTADSTKAGAAAAVAAGSPEDKLRLLSVNFTGLSYDFVIADSVGGSLFNRRGITDQNWGFSARSDLLPGFDFRMNYSLFLGNPQSDTAVFKPYLTDVNVTFSLDKHSRVFGTLGRLFGFDVGTPSQTSVSGTTNRGNPRTGDAMFSQRAAAQQVAGSRSRDARFDTPASEAWQANFTFTSARQRPDIRGPLVEIDPTVQCQGLKQVGDLIGYELCLANARIAPQAGTPQIGNPTYGGPVYRQPPTRSLQGQTSFHLTPKWGAQWSTTYDMVRGEFASNVVSLQRELHDWRAVFAFTQAPNGNFSFNFFVALKAEPDLKFDYNRNTYSNAGSQF